MGYEYEWFCLERVSLSTNQCVQSVKYCKKSLPKKSLVFFKISFISVYYNQLAKLNSLTIKYYRNK